MSAHIISDVGRHLLHQPAELRHRISHGRIRKVMRRQPMPLGDFQRMPVSDDVSASRRAPFNIRTFKP